MISFQKTVLYYDDVQIGTEAECTQIDTYVTPSGKHTITSYFFRAFLYHMKVFATLPCTMQLPNPRWIQSHDQSCSR